MLEPGDTFYVCEPGADYDTHLWIVISDPRINDEKIVIANMTKIRDDKEKICILKVGDHPYIRHETCIYYEGAKIVSASQLTLLLSSNLLVSRERISHELLERIRQGVLDSTRMPMKCADVLFEQELIE